MCEFPAEFPPPRLTTASHLLTMQRKVTLQFKVTIYRITPDGKSVNFHPGKKRTKLWKKHLDYDKLIRRMTTSRKPAYILLVATLCLLALSALSCEVDPVPGRYTYVVKYEVTANAAVTVDIDYTNEAAAPINVPGWALAPATPWSYEFPAAFRYDDPYFYPTLSVSTAALTPPTDEVVAKIIWKDYRVGFEEQVLVLDRLYDDGSISVDGADLVGPELPRP